MSTLPIPIQYANPHSQITPSQGLIILLARDRSPKLREFLTSGPAMEAEWFNQIVDWLVENYPEDFVLTPK